MLWLHVMVAGSMCVLHDLGTSCNRLTVVLIRGVATGLN
jgi:hypothetical protein